MYQSPQNGRPPPAGQNYVNSFHPGSKQVLVGHSEMLPSHGKRAPPQPVFTPYHVRPPAPALVNAEPPLSQVAVIRASELVVPGSRDDPSTPHILLPRRNLILLSVAPLPYLETVSR